jgi:hypothetical protein
MIATSLASQYQQIFKDRFPELPINEAIGLLAGVVGLTMAQALYRCLFLFVFVSLLQICVVFSIRNYLLVVR